MKSSENKETLDKSETKILKSKNPRMERGTPERTARVEEKRGKGLYARACYGL